MFLQKELNPNNDYDNKPLTGSKSQLYAKPDESNENLQKMFLEMQSIVKT